MKNMIGCCSKVFDKTQTFGAGADVCLCRPLPRNPLFRGGPKSDLTRRDWSNDFKTCWVCLWGVSLGPESFELVLSLMSLDFTMVADPDGRRLRIRAT